MLRRAMGVVCAVLAIGMAAGCSDSGDDGPEGFSPEEATEIAQASEAVAVYCANRLIERSTGRVVTDGPTLDEARAGLEALIRLGDEKPDAEFTPPATDPGTTGTDGAAGTDGAEGAETSTATTPVGTGTGTVTTPTAPSGTSTTGTSTAPAVDTGPRTITDILLDLSGAVEGGCDPGLSALISAALAVPPASETGGTATGGTSPPATSGTGTATAPETTAPAPAPEVLRGTESLESEISVPRRGPLIVTGAHNGQGTFAVRLEPAGGDSLLVFERSGRYRGQTFVAEPGPGRARVRVQASGPWTLRFAQPTADPAAPALPGEFTGRGSRVLAVQAPASFRAAVAARHDGGGRFIARLVGYGGNAGTQVLFDQTGAFSDRTTTDVAVGTYLLAIQADGSWSVGFDQ
jgi:hypothetical protein